MKDTLWSRDFILHTLAYWMMAMSFYFLIPTLPEFVITILNKDKSEVGLIIGFYAISALMVRPVSGYLFDKYGRRYLYLGSLLIFSLVMALYNYANTFAILLLIRLLHGAVWGILTTGGSTIAADIIPEKKRGVGIGIFGLSFTLSMAFGPLVGDYILHHFGFNALFYASCITGLLSFMLASRVHMPLIREKSKKISPGNLFDVKVAPIAGIMVLMAFPFAGIMSFIILFTKELGMEGGRWFFLFYAAGVSLSRVLAGEVMDKRGPEPVIAACIVLSFTGMSLIATSTTMVMLFGSALLAGIGNGLIMPVMQTMTINMVRPERRGVANATLFSAIDLGFAIGSWVLGFIADMYGLSSMYWFCGFIMLIPGAYLFLYGFGYYRKHTLSAATTVSGNG